MASIHENVTEQFYAWEQRGRGWKVFDEPVSPEPPFRPFYDHRLPNIPVVDDGRRPTLLSSLVRKLNQVMRTEPPPAPDPVEVEEEPGPETLIRDPLVELQTSLPAKLDIAKDTFEHFLLNLSLCREPVAFEVLGLPERITLQFAAHPDDVHLLRRQLQAHFPEAAFQPREGVLLEAWGECEGDEALVAEFGLAREFMLPLATGKVDPFVGLVGALTELEPGELGLFQVVFQPVREPWAESITRSVTYADGSPFFVNRPELADAAKHKIARALFAAVVRVALVTKSFERSLQLARDMTGSLRVFANPQGNELIPLENSEYPLEDHIEDVLRRQSRRSGMLLNSDELIGFVHLPSSAVRSPGLERETGKTKAAPTIARSEGGILLGNNVHAERTISVRLTPEQRVRHMHIVGASGTGKSTLLYNLIRQDIESGEGLAILDPHGDLVDRVLGIIPANRINDVVLVDPSDEEFSVGFNILSAHSNLEKNLIASDLISVFQRLSASWGDQMGSVLTNAILAFLESSRRATLADLRRFLIEPAFRADFLTTVNDPSLLYYWHKGFAQLSGNKSIGPVLTRLETFLAPKPIRYMVSQPENRLDFAQIMDTGKIFLAKLSQGLLGKENSYLLGTLLVSKFQQLAMARQSQQVGVRKDFWVYIDEFHNFITPSMAEILGGARKYRIGLVLAHQELRQLQRDSEVASAVLTNPYTRVCFRVGADDARKLSESFSFFEARDLQNLGTGEAVARVERSDYDFNLTVPLFPEPDPAEAAGRRQEVIKASREKYATPSAQVEAVLRKAWEADRPPQRVSPKPVVVEERPQSPKEEPPRATVPIPPPPQPAASSAATVSTPSEAKVRSEPAALGKGGAQHQAIQRRIKQCAEGLGFRSVIEKEVLNGQGSVDLLLERLDKTFACEISITTTVDHEVGNVAKCLKAGFSTVAIICVEEERLKKIAVAVRASLGAEAAATVEYFQPDQFIAHLQGLPLPAVNVPETVKTRRGYKVKRSVPKLKAEDQKQREDVIIQAITDAMRPKKK